MNYNKIKETVWFYEYEAEGSRSGESVMFQTIAEDILDACDNRLSANDFEEILRYHRLNSWMNLRGGEKELMDNMLGAVLDIVTFG